MELAAFQRFFKKERSQYIMAPGKMVNHVFKELGFEQKTPDYFLNNPTEFVLAMRNGLWDYFLELERDFTADMAEHLIANDNRLNSSFRQINTENITGSEKLRKTIHSFFKEYDQHIYELHKSNTQSRRSRAGQEFEHILYKLLTYANIPFDNQGVIGTNLFSENGLGKLVDCVVPGVLEYNVEKPKCILISMKTSLRERWQEVPEELARTGAHSMYLFTLDDNISNTKIDSLYNHNVYLIVLDDTKESKFKNNPKVYGLSKFLKELQFLVSYWEQKDTAELGKKFFNTKRELYRMRLEDATLSSEKDIYKKYILELKNKVNS